MASLASLSARSFPLLPAWAFIHVKSICQFSFSKSFVFLLNSSNRCFLFLAFLRENMVILLSVYTLTVRGVCVCVCACVRV